MLSIKYLYLEMSSYKNHSIFNSSYSVYVKTMKMRVALLVLASVACVAGLSTTKVIGGSATTIQQYPFMAAVLESYDWGSTFTQTCAGTILTSATILSSGECIIPRALSLVRIRVGSTYASSGGAVHLVDDFLEHPGYNELTAANDIALIYLETRIALGPNVATASISGQNYVVADNQPVWAVGWGATQAGELRADQLHHVQMLSLDTNTCSTRYSTAVSPVNTVITANHLCADWPAGGRDHCYADMGGPLLHFNTVVGVLGSMWRCGTGGPPSLSARVSSYTSWIVANAR